MTTILTTVTAAGNIYTSQTWPAQPPGLPQPSATDAASAGAAPISRLGFETVALVISTSVAGTETNDGTTITNTAVISGVSLPANAQVGDAVVVKYISGPTEGANFNVWVPVGHYLGGGPTPTLNGYGSPSIYQMVSPNVWYTI